MLLPHFKRTNLCAHGTPALTHMAGVLPNPRERMMDMVESLRPTPERQTLHKAVDDGIRYEQARNMQKLLAEEIVKQASGALLQT